MSNKSNPVSLLPHLICVALRWWKSMCILLNDWICRDVTKCVWIFSSVKWWHSQCTHTAIKKAQALFSICLRGRAESISLGSKLIKETASWSAVVNTTPHSSVFWYVIDCWLFLELFYWGNPFNSVYIFSLFVFLHLFLTDIQVNVILITLSSGFLSADLVLESW